MSKSNQTAKLVITQILTEYGIRMTSEELRILTEDRMNYQFPNERWNQIVKELSEITGMIEVTA